MTVSEPRSGRGYAPAAGQASRLGLDPRYVWFAIAIFLGLIYSGELLAYLTSPRTAAGGDTTVLTRVLALAIYAATGILICFRGARALRFLASSLLLIGLFLLTALSALWSLTPGETMERWIALTGSSLAALYLVTYFDYRQFLRVVALAMLLALAISAVVSVALPDYGITKEGIWVAAWKGLFVHKNILGRAAAYGFVLMLILTLAGYRERLLYIGGLAVCLIILFFAQSTTAILVLSGGIGFLAIARLFQLSANRAVILSMPFVGIVLLMVIALVAYGGFAELMGALGKDVTLTGRLPMWEQSWHYAMQRPWFGYGYEVFWEESNTPVHFIERALGFRPPHAHNGLIETWLSLGAVGTALMVAILTVTAWKAAMLARSGRELILLWPLVFVFMFIASNITETAMLARNDFTWILFVAIVLLLNNRYHMHLARPRDLSHSAVPRHVWRANRE